MASLAVGIQLTRHRSHYRCLAPSECSVGGGIDLLNAARQDREHAIDAFIRTHHAIETASLADPEWGVKAVHRARAKAVNEQLACHLPALDAALAENARLLGDTLRAGEVRAHLRPLRAEATAAQQQIDRAVNPTSASRGGPGF